MKTTIYFFTGTGNSLKIARSISEKIDDCEIVPIAKIWKLKNLTATSETVGFIFPLYASGLPKIVYDFVNKIDLSKSNYIFTVITSGGGSTKLPLQQLERILNKKAKKLNAGFLIVMPNNYIIGYNTTSENRQKELFEKAFEQAGAISEMVKNKEFNLDLNILEKNLNRDEKFNIKFREIVNESDKSFYIDNNCNSCSICEEICPVNNIILIEGKPQWQHKCQQCIACINYCPEKSIQFGTHTLKTQRYHHPEITLQDIGNQRK
jgi:ferredoxin